MRLAVGDREQRVQVQLQVVQMPLEQQLGRVERRGLCLCQAVSVSRVHGGKNQIISVEATSRTVPLVVRRCAVGVSRCRE